MPRHAEGILFDTAYVEPEIHLWILGAGELLSLSIPFAPLLYLTGPRRVVEHLVVGEDVSSVLEPVGWTTRQDFWSGQPQRVFACRVWKAHAATSAVRRLLHQDHRLRAYDVDIDPCLSFHSQHNLFPLARVSVSWDTDKSTRRLVYIRALDDPWEPEYQIPDLRTLRLRLARSPLIPLNRGNWIIAEVGNVETQLRPEDGAQALRLFNGLLRDHDPDAIVSQRGDQFIFPWLLETSAKVGLPLALDRQAPSVERRIKRQGKTLHVYSGIQFKAPEYPLLGRWHLDLTNSFFADKAGIEGVVEMARLSRLPVQRQARTSGGTAITAMEIHLALRRGILVPFIKDQVEPFRSALALLREDKGGLTYYPPVGIYEGVLEVDYHQMYPTIMAVHNVSPETMDCGCCPGQQVVPGTTHHTCTNRRGLVPDALQGLLTKRLRYKQLIKQSNGALKRCYETRATALKWTLVTTFGYQGFHNAKFGLIAAHEAITAWGRESLLRAKEVFEANGYTMLHALTDSMYVQKEGMNLAVVDKLCDEVQQQTGLTLGIEGVYDWIAFLPSKRREMSVATRYFGRFRDGQLKVRGVKVRQHSTPPFLRHAQETLLRVMMACHTVRELERAVPCLRLAYAQLAAELWSGRVDPAHLAIQARVSQNVESYKSASPVAVCLRILKERGVEIPAGQVVRYVIVERKHKRPSQRYMPEPFLHEVKDYDAKEYERLLRDTYEEVCGLLLRSNVDTSARNEAGQSNFL